MDTSHSTDLLLSDLTVLQASDKSDNAFFKVLYRIYFIFYRYQSFGRSIAIRPDGSGATDIKFNLPGRRAICFLGSQTFPSKHLFLYSSNARGSPVSPKVFNFMVRKVLHLLVFENVMRYSAKSFRVGAASETYSLGFPLMMSRVWADGIPMLSWNTSLVVHGFRGPVVSTRSWPIIIAASGFSLSFPDWLGVVPKTILLVYYS